MTAGAVARPWNLRGIALMAAGHGASDFYSGMVPFVVFYDVTRGGMPAWLQGVLALIWYGTSSVAQPLFGAYADRHERRWYLPASIALTTVSLLAATAVTSPLALIALVVLGGIGSAVMHPEAGRYASLLGGDRRASAISYYQIGGQVGYGLGPLAIAALLAHGGPGEALALAIPGLAIAGALAAIMPGLPIAPPAERAAAHGDGSATDRFAISLLVGSTALRHLVTAAFAYFLPNVLAARGYSLAASGAIVTGFIVVAALGMVAGGAIADRRGPIGVSIVSLIVSAPLLAAALLTNGALSIVLLFAGAAALAMQNAPGVTLAQAFLPRRLGVSLGLMNGVAFGIGSAGVALVGIAVTRTGPSASLAATAVAPVLAALGFVAVARRMPAVAIARNSRS